MKRILILLVYGMTFVLIHYLSSDISLSVVSKTHSKNVFRQFKTSELLAHQKLRGEFTAAYNNLGIVLIRINTYQRINQDFLIFRIREKGSKNWYYQNKYDTLQFSNNQFYPFGFSIIREAKGKLYEFEIVSTLGTRGNAIAVSAQEPVAMTKYQYPKTNIAILIYNKFLNGVENYNLLFVSLAFLTPLLIYLLRQNFTAILLTVLLIIYDLFFVRNIYDMVILTFVIDIIILARTKLFVFAFVFLFLCAMSNLFQWSIPLEKSAVYVFLLLTVGTINSIGKSYL